MENDASYADLVEEVQCFRALLMDYARQKQKCSLKENSFVTHCNTESDKYGTVSAESRNEDRNAVQTYDEKDQLMGTDSNVSNESCSTSAQSNENISYHKSVNSINSTATKTNSQEIDENQRSEPCRSLNTQSKERKGHCYTHSEKRASVDKIVQVSEHPSLVDVSTQTDEADPLKSQGGVDDRDQNLESSSFLLILCHRCGSNNICYEATCLDCHEYYETPKFMDSHVGFNEKKRLCFHMQNCTEVDFLCRTDKETKTKRRKITVKEFFSELRRRHGFFKIDDISGNNYCTHNSHSFYHSEVEEKTVAFRSKNMTTSDTFGFLGLNRKISTRNRSITRPDPFRGEIKTSSERTADSKFSFGPFRRHFYGTKRYGYRYSRMNSSRFRKMPYYEDKSKRKFHSQPAPYFGPRKSSCSNSIKRSYNIPDKNSSRIEVEEKETKQEKPRSASNFELNSVVFERDRNSVYHNGENYPLDQTTDKTQMHTGTLHNSQRQNIDSMSLKFISHEGRPSPKESYPDPTHHKSPGILFKKFIKDVDLYHDEERRVSKSKGDHSTDYKGTNDIATLSLRKLYLNKTPNRKFEDILKLKSNPHLRYQHIETPGRYTMKECIPHHRLELADNFTFYSDNINCLKPKSLDEEDTHSIFLRHSAVDSKKMQCFDISVSKIMSDKTDILEKIDELCDINLPLSPLADSAIDSSDSDCWDDSDNPEILTYDDRLFKVIDSSLPDETTQTRREEVDEQSLSLVTRNNEQIKRKRESFSADLIHKNLQLENSDPESYLKSTSDVGNNTSHTHPIFKQRKMKLREYVHSDSNNCNGDKADDEPGSSETNEFTTILSIGDNFESTGSFFEYDRLKSPIVLNASDRVFDIGDTNNEMANSNSVTEASVSSSDVSTILGQVRQTDDILLTAMTSAGLSQKAVENFLTSCSDTYSLFLDENTINPLCGSEDTDEFLDQIFTQDDIISMDQVSQGDHKIERDLSRYERNSILLSTEPNGQCENDLRPISPGTGKLLTGENISTSKPEFVYHHNSAILETENESGENKQQNNLEFQISTESNEQESKVLTELLPLSLSGSISGISCWMNEPNANYGNEQNIRGMINPDECILDLVDNLNPSTESQVYNSDMMIPYELTNCQQVATNDIVTRSSENKLEPPCQTASLLTDCPSDRKTPFLHSNSYDQVNERRGDNISTSIVVNDTYLEDRQSMTNMLSRGRRKCVIARKLIFDGNRSDTNEEPKKRSNRRKRKPGQLDDSIESPNGRTQRVTRSRRSSTRLDKTCESSDDKRISGISTRRSMRRRNSRTDSAQSLSTEDETKANERATSSRLLTPEIASTSMENDEASKTPKNPAQTSTLSKPSSNTKIKSLEIETKTVSQDGHLLMKDYRRPKAMLRRCLKSISTKKADSIPLLKYFHPRRMPANSHPGDTNNNADNYDNSSTSSDISLSECSSSTKSDAQRNDMTRKLESRYKELEQQYRKRYQSPTRTFFNDSMALKPLSENSKCKTNDDSLKGKSKLKLTKKCRPTPKEQCCKKDSKSKTCLFNFVRRIQGSYGDQFPIASLTSKEKRHEICNKYLEKYGVNSSGSRLISGANSNEESAERQKHQLDNGHSDNIARDGAKNISLLETILNEGGRNGVKSDNPAVASAISHEMSDCNAGGSNYNQNECPITLNDGTMCKKSKSSSETNLSEDTSSVHSSKSPTFTDTSKLDEISQSQGDILKKKIEKIEQDFQKRFEPLFSSASVDNGHSPLGLERKQSSKSSSKEKDQEKWLAILHKFENLVSHSEHQTPDSNSKNKEKLELPPIAPSKSSIQKMTDQSHSSSQLPITLNFSYEMENWKQVDVREDANDEPSSKLDAGPQKNNLGPQTHTKEQADIDGYFSLILEEHVSEEVPDGTSETRWMSTLPKLEGTEFSSCADNLTHKKPRIADNDVKLPFLSNNDNHGVWGDEQVYNDNHGFWGDEQVYNDNHGVWGDEQGKKISLNNSGMDIHNESSSSTDKDESSIPGESNDQNITEAFQKEWSSSLDIGAPLRNREMCLDVVDDSKKAINNPWLLPTTSHNIVTDATKSGNSRLDSDDDICDTTGVCDKDIPLPCLGLSDHRSVKKQTPPPSAKPPWIENKTCGFLSPILEDPNEEEM